MHEVGSANDFAAEGRAQGLVPQADAEDGYFAAEVTDEFDADAGFLRSTRARGNHDASGMHGVNFGDGHLHDEKLLKAVQEQCGFDDGELRCIMVEAQPLGRKTLHWRIADANTGVREEGQVKITDLLSRTPWG